MPKSAGAGLSEIETFWPEWRPIPVQGVTLRRVRWAGIYAGFILSYSKPTAKLTWRLPYSAKQLSHKDLPGPVPNCAPSNRALLWPMSHKKSTVPCGTLDTGVMKLPPAFSYPRPQPETDPWPSRAHETPLPAFPLRPPGHLQPRPPVRDR